MVASFSSTPSTIVFTSGPWHTNNSRYYTKHAASETSQYVRYELSTGGSILSTVHGISFTATSSGILLDVNDGVPGSNEPLSFSSPTNTLVSSGTVSVGHSIDLYNPHGTAPSNISAVFTVPPLGFSSGIQLQGTGGSGGNTGAIHYNATNSKIEVTIDASSESDSTISYYVSWLSGLQVYQYGPYGHTLGTTDTYEITSNDPLNGTWRLYTNDGNSSILILDEEIVGGGPFSVSTTRRKKVHCNFW